MSKKSQHTIGPLTLVGKLYDHMIRAVSSSEDAQKKKNIILFVGKVFPHMVDAIRQYEKEHDIAFRIALIYDKTKKMHRDTKQTLERIHLSLPADFSSPQSIHDALDPYQQEFVAITTRGEDHIPDLHTIIPYVPYLPTPTHESLIWATNKLEMRKRFRIHAPEITPNFRVVQDISKKTLASIQNDLTLPVIVKPSGLAASRHVGICFYKEELEAFLKKVFKQIDKTYEETKGNWTPQVLVEEYMEGQQYSIDAYVSAKGSITFCPPVSVKTGRSIGFDDFFGYRQMTPTKLSDQSIAEAEDVCTKAIQALGLRSVTAHVELLRTEQGWKVVEVAPRIGGFRHMLYEGAYGFNHTMNDVLVRMGKKPIVKKKVQGHTVAMKFFAKEEGKLVKIEGIKKIQELKSLKKLYINKKPGDVCKFAKHGGSSVFNLIMVNKDRSHLLADIRRLEQTINIHTE